MDTKGILEVAKNALLRGEDIGRTLFVEFAACDPVIAPIADDVPYRTPMERVIALAYAGREIAQAAPNDRIVCVCLLQRGGMTKVAPGTWPPRGAGDPRRQEIIKMTLFDVEQGRYEIHCPEIVRNAKQRVTALIQDLHPVILLGDAALDAALFGYEYATLSEDAFIEVLMQRFAHVKGPGEAWGVMAKA